jgi:hypothetical protein
MNRWVRVLGSGIIVGVVTAFLLMLSGLSTSSVLTNEGTYFTSTTISLDVNVFALLMIIGASLTVIVVNFIFEAAGKSV